MQTACRRRVYDDRKHDEQRHPHVCLHARKHDASLASPFDEEHAKRVQEEAKEEDVALGQLFAPQPQHDQEEEGKAEEKFKEEAGIVDAAVLREHGQREPLCRAARDQSAVGVVVEKVAPASDAQRQQRPRRHAVQGRKRRELFALCIDDGHKKADEDRAKEHHAALGKIEVGGEGDDAERGSQQSCSQQSQRHAKDAKIQRQVADQPHALGVPFRYNDRGKNAHGIQQRIPIDRKRSDSKSDLVRIHILTSKRLFQYTANRPKKE